MTNLYKDFRPTLFDARGLGLPDRQDWVIVSVIRTRDSGILAESNFHAALEQLGGESEHVEVRRFGHWGPGWFEVILVDPTREDLVREVDSITSALAHYPVLDDTDFSEREHEAKGEAWDEYGARDFVEGLTKHIALHPETVDFLVEHRFTAAVWDFHGRRTRGDECMDEGVHFNFNYTADVTRDAIAGLIREIRKEQSK